MYNKFCELMEAKFKFGKVRSPRPLPPPPPSIPEDPRDPVQFSVWCPRTHKLFAELLTLLNHIQKHSPRTRHEDSSVEMQKGRLCAQHLK